MVRLIYKSMQKATKDAEGITQVILDSNGNLIDLGTVTFKKGSKNFKAILMDGTNLDGKFKTKKQAGGALQKHYNGKYAIKKHGPAPKPAPVAKPEVVKPKLAPKPEPVVEAAPEPAVPVEPAKAVEAMVNTFVRENIPSLLDDDFDGEGYPEMPDFLRRDLWTDEEREFNSAEY